MKLKPSREGLQVRFPDAPSRILPPEGAEVEFTPGWARRLSSGDVVEVLPVREVERAPVVRPVRTGEVKP